MSAATEDVLQFEIADPSRLAGPDWQQIRAILTEGGAVNIASALREIPRSSLVAVVRNSGSLVGLAVIKRPRPDYATDVMSDAEFEFDAHMSELGYVAVHQDFRGKHYSGRLVDTLLAKFNKPLFSTTDSAEMKYTLGNRGFTKRGRDWRGKRGPLTLWLRLP